MSMPIQLSTEPVKTIIMTMYQVTKQQDNDWAKCDLPRSLCPRRFLLLSVQATPSTESEGKTSSFLGMLAGVTVT